MKTRNYTREIKERAVRMLIKAAGDYPSTWSAIQAIAPKIGCTPKTLRSWHKKHIAQTITVNVQAQSQEQHIKDLKRENRELKQANEIIRKAATFFAQAETGRPPIKSGRFTLQIYLLIYKFESTQTTLHMQLKIRNGNASLLQLYQT